MDLFEEIVSKGVEVIDDRKSKTSSSWSYFHYVQLRTSFSSLVTSVNSLHVKTNSVAEKWSEQLRRSQKTIGRVFALKVLSIIIKSSECVKRDWLVYPSYLSVRAKEVSHLRII